MEIIDFHTHIYPDHIAAKATRATCTFYGLDTDQVGSLDQLIQLGSQAGISRYVIHPVATHPTGVRHINEHTAATVASHAELEGFGTIHPDMEHATAELEFIRASGLKGLKLHPDMQLCQSDDERLFTVYEKCCEMGLPILIHCGDKTRDYSHPRHLRRALDRFPDLTVIAAHMGGWSHWDEAFEYLGPTSCYLDISSCTMFMPAEQVATYIRAFGAHRVLFGTDFPVWNPSTEVNTFLSLPLSDEEKELIASGNAKRLLGI
jgi:predicted TIM-barrel fold metal-dependent hydrolase